MGFFFGKHREARLDESQKGLQPKITPLTLLRSCVLPGVSQPIPSFLLPEHKTCIHPQIEIS